MLVQQTIDSNNNINKLAIYDMSTKSFIYDGNYRTIARVYQNATDSSTLHKQESDTITIVVTLDKGEIIERIRLDDNGNVQYDSAGNRITTAAAILAGEVEEKAPRLVERMYGGI